LLALLAAAFFVWAMWGPAYARLGEAVGREDLAAAFGLFNTICFLGAIAGPSLTGWARDRAGSFTAGCYLATLVALVGAAIAAWLRSPLDVARTAVG
jgi:MFS-type transporter involved in bile tolerance (Atg22 family)